MSESNTGKVISLSLYRMQRQVQEKAGSEQNERELNEQLDRVLLELLKEGPKTIQELPSLPGVSKPKVAGRLNSLNRRGFVLKLARWWCLPPEDSPHEELGGDVLFDGSEKLKESGCPGCQDWTTHLCSLRLLRFYQSQFQAAATPERLKEVGLQLRSYPLPEPHLSHLRDLYRKRLQQLKTP